MNMKKHCPMCGDWFTTEEGNTDSYCPACRQYANEFEREIHDKVSEPGKEAEK